jgi:hypothetical protein
MGHRRGLVGYCARGAQIPIARRRRRGYQRGRCIEDASDARFDPRCICNRQEDFTSKPFVIAPALLASLGGFDPATAHAGFINAFNNRQCGDLKPLLADDIVFHSANAAEVYSRSGQVLGHFEKTIGGEWNVKFAKIDFTNQSVGNDGRVVARSDFAVTASAKDDSCYAGSYMMT